MRATKSRVECHQASNLKILITDREREILNLISYELTEKEIALKLFLSPHTVQSHRRNLMAKLGAKNTAGLIVRAFKNRLLTIDL